MYNIHVFVQDLVLDCGPQSSASMLHISFGRDAPCVGCDHNVSLRGLIIHVVVQFAMCYEGRT